MNRLCMALGSEDTGAQFSRLETSCGTAVKAALALDSTKEVLMLLCLAIELLTEKKKTE